MERERQGATQDTLDAWKELVEITRSIYPLKHPASAHTTTTDDMLAIVNEQLAGTFTTEKIKERIAMLKHAFPSSPQRLPLLGFSIRHEDDRFQHVNFAAEYAARHFLDLLLQDTKFKWVTDYEIEVHEPFFFWIKSDGVSLDDLMEYKMTKEEQDWELPAPYPALATRIRRGKAPSGEHQLITPDEPIAIKPKTSPAPVKNVPRTPAKPKKAPRPSAEGLITIGDVAAEYGFDAKAARGILRKHSIEKPDHGRWEWKQVPPAVIKAFKAEQK